MGPDRLKCGSASCLIGLLLLAASGACQGPSGTATTAITTTSTGTGTGTGTADPAPAGSCPSPALSGSYPAPSAAPGYRAYIVANKLVKPRTIVPDRAGNFLVLEQGRGVVALTFGDGGGCVVEKSRKSVIENHDLNHGLQLSSDGRVLYASSADAVYAWSYDSESMSVAGFGGGGSTAPLTIVSGMQNEDHSTRTLLLLRSPPSSSSSSSGQQRLLISRGSADNIDETAADINSGHSQIKAFDVSSHSLSSPQDFNSNGTLVAWGLRNSVGLAQHPATGGLYSVENSADNIFRQGKDVHQDNPGEELNFHGYLNDSASAASADRQSLNFGYPTCFATWEVSSLPGNASLAVGTPFAVDGPDGSRSKLDDADSTCAKQSVAPRLTFAAHTAPLDIKFNTEGSVAWVTFHGSWDRSDPIGYKLSAIRFKDGAPIDASDSRTAAIDILSNRDTSQCPDHCFRPVGLAWDSQGRLYMSSDATGEIYVLVRTDGSRTEGTLPDAGSTSSSTSSSMYSSTSSSSSSALPSGSSHSGTMSVSFDSFCLLMFALIVLTSWSC